MKIVSGVLEHKNYCGTIEYTVDDGVLFGEVMGIKSLISYEGETLKTLEMNFKEAIDGYLEWCSEESIEPEKPIKYKVSLNMVPDLQQDAS